MNGATGGRAWVAVCAVVVLSGCGGPTPLGEHFAGLPAGMDVIFDPGSGAVRIDRDGRIYVTMWGSSSCPDLPVRVRLDDTGRLQVTTSSGTGPCTMDLVPTTSVVTAPDAFDARANDTALLNGVEVPLLLLPVPS